jgi:hypothetical protein
MQNTNRVISTAFNVLPLLNVALLAWAVVALTNLQPTQPQLTAAHSRISQLETRQTNQLQYAETRINSLASSLDTQQNETQRRFKLLENRSSGQN